MYKTATTEASNFVSGVDLTFMIILGVSFFFIIAITVTMLVFVYRYNKKRHPKAVQIEGNNTIEIIWTAIPLILVLIMFYFGWAGWKPMTEVPDDAFPVTAEARMWKFSFIYPNGKRTDTLYVAQGRPVKIDLKALDVIHSLYIPAFRVKEDMVPGKEKMMWFNPMSPGEFDLFCAEYCGLNHSYMYSSVHVLPPEKFDQWYADTTQVKIVLSEDPAKAGYNILQNNGCLACHSIDGRKLVGPTYKGLFGSKRTVLTPKGEKNVIADEEYIIRAINYPNAEIVDGYIRGVMLPYRDVLSGEQVSLIVDYLETLKAN